MARSCCTRRLPAGTCLLATGCRATDLLLWRRSAGRAKLSEALESQGRPAR